MTQTELLLRMAKDEAETLVNYQNMIDETDIDEDVKGIVDEIMGDEYNHALICLLSAAKISGVKIATDDISEDPNKIEVE